MIARAIAGRPEVLLLDESLDSMADGDAEKILQQIVSPEQSWTVVLVTNREQLKAMMDVVISLSP